MSSVVICNCPKPHRQHDFRASGFSGLCTDCSHGVGSHKATSQQSAETADYITRLVNTHEVDDVSLTTSGNGVLRLEFTLRPIKN